MAAKDLLAALCGEKYVHCMLGRKGIVAAMKYSEWPGCPECGGRHKDIVVGNVTSAEAAKRLGLAKNPNGGWVFTLPACLWDEAWTSLRAADWRLVRNDGVSIPKGMIRGDKL